MTEPLDLDALERECATAAHVCNRTTSVLELIAELRACRYAAGELAAERDENSDSALSAWNRAELAEAELRSLRSWVDGAKVDIEGLRDRAERAEAALARVEALCHKADTQPVVDPPNGWWTARVRAALRGES